MGERVMIFEKWWEGLNEFWEANNIPPDLERVAVAKGAWDAAISACTSAIDKELQEPSPVFTAGLELAKEAIYALETK